MAIFVLVKSGDEGEVGIQRAGGTGSHEGLVVYYVERLRGMADKLDAYSS